MKKDEALSLAKAINPNIKQIISSRSIARLWGGMGAIIEIRCNNSITIIAKRINCRNPTSYGDKRKLASYIVESNFYSQHSNDLCDSICCRCLLVQKDDELGHNITIAMTPLPNPTITYLNGDTALAAIRSVARLHAHFWGEEKSMAAVSAGLAPQGTYWYLDTRPDEYESMSKHGFDGKLRLVARDIDEALKYHPYQTCLHGDLKACNMSLSTDPRYVTFVDFQYIGRGCPSKDLAYLFVCGMDVEEDFETSQEEEYLNIYIQELMLNGVDKSLLPSLLVLRKALDLAYCDLYRWMCGWGVWGNGFLPGRVERCLDDTIQDISSIRN